MFQPTKSPTSSIAALHRDLRERARRLGLESTLTVAVVQDGDTLRWCQTASVTEGVGFIPNSPSLLRRRLAAELRDPSRSVFGPHLSGVVRHDPENGPTTALYLRDGTAAAVRDKGKATVALGNWMNPEVDWGLPDELRGGLLDEQPLRSPLVYFAEALGVDALDLDTQSLSAALCRAATQRPTAAADFGLDAATVSLLPTLVAHSCDLVDILVGRFDPWSTTESAELSWPTPKPTGSPAADTRRRETWS